MKLVYLLTLILSINAYPATKEEIVKEIGILEEAYKIPDKWLYAIVAVESAFQSKIINTKAQVHSHGVAQLTRSTAKWCGLAGDQIYDYRLNLGCAAKYLKNQMSRFRTKKEIIMSYNEGTPCYCRDGYYKRKYFNPKSRSYFHKICTPIDEGAPVKCTSEGELRVTSYYGKFMAKLK